MTEMWRIFTGEGDDRHKGMVERKNANCCDVEEAGPGVDDDGSVLLVNCGVAQLNLNQQRTYIMVITA